MTTCHNVEQAIGELFYSNFSPIVKNMTLIVLPITSSIACVSKSIFALLAPKISEPSETSYLKPEIM